MTCRTSALIVYIDYKHECIFTVGNDKIFMLSAWPHGVGIGICG